MIKIILDETPTMKLPRFLHLFLVLVLFLASCSAEDLFGSFTDVPEVTPSEDNLVMAFAEAPGSYSPLSYSTADRRYLANFYEPLVRYDADFNLITGLAVAWGRYDDLTWEFRLRDGVYFHDGSIMDAEDVVYSFEMAMSESDSELASLLKDIVSVEKSEDGKIKIVTEILDPLLLHRLTAVYIMPDGYANFTAPIGTGSYYVSAYEDGDLFLRRFEDYWGNEPYFASVTMKYIPDPVERYETLMSGEVDFLINVPPQYVEDIRRNKLGVFSFSSLEVSFLMMNENGVFADPNLRAAVWNSIKTNYSDQLGSGYLLPTHQFAAVGIAGYKTEFVNRSVDLDLAKEHRGLHEGAVSVTLDLPAGLEVLGEGVADDLAEIDIQVDVNILSSEQLATKILSGESEFYFFGWKYDLADSADFYESVVYTGGQYNGIRYSNPTIDALIEDAAKELDTSSRLLLLKKIAEELLADQAIMPLFESKVLFATKNGVNWNVRLDGQVLASEIVRFMVE